MLRWKLESDLPLRSWIERKDRFDAGNLLFLDQVPIGVAHEEQAAFRVVDDVDDVAGGEILENRDDDRAEGDRGHVGDTPAGVVAADECDLVALPDPRLAEEQVQFGDLFGHLIVRKVLVLEVVGQGGKLAVVAETLFVNTDQVLL